MLKYAKFDIYLLEVYLKYPKSRCIDIYMIFDRYRQIIP